MKTFLNNLEKIIKQLGDFTRDGRNYNLGYVTALKDEELIRFGDDIIPILENIETIIKQGR